MGKIFRLFDKTNNAKQLSVEDFLMDMLDQVKSGKFSAKSKCVIVMLDNENGQYNTNSQQCGMKHSEAVALLETAKLDIVMNMKLEGIK